MPTIDELMKAGTAQFLGKYPRDIAQGEVEAINASDSGIFAQFLETRARALKVPAEIADIGLWRVDGTGSFDRDWLADWPAITPLDGLSWSDMDRFKIADAIKHTWLTSSARHYDLERPQGVDNPFELPIVTRQIVAFIENDQPQLADRLRDKAWYREVASELDLAAPSM